MSGPAHRVFLLLGSNINPRYFIPQAIQELRRFLVIEDISTPWETTPVGTPGSNFINAAVRARTILDRQGLIEDLIRPLEARLGRQRTHNKNAPRTIDLDIIIFDEELLESRLWTQSFIAVPMAEVFPKYIHPESGKTLQEIAAIFLSSENLIPQPDILPHPKISDIRPKEK